MYNLKGILYSIRIPTEFNANFFRNHFVICIYNHNLPAFIMTSMMSMLCAVDEFMDLKTNMITFHLILYNIYLNIRWCFHFFASIHKADIFSNAEGRIFKNNVFVVIIVFLINSFANFYGNYVQYHISVLAATWGLT